MKNYIDFCNDTEQRETVATKAKQKEYQYFIDKIKKRLQYISLLPEALSLPARQDLKEIAAIYKILGAMPEYIQIGNSVKLSLLNLVNLHYENKRMIMERNKILKMTRKKVEEEKKVNKKLTQTLYNLRKEKPDLDAKVETLKGEIEDVLGPKQKVYEYKEYVAKVLFIF